MVNTIVVRAVVGFHPYTSTDKWTVNITVIRAEFDSTHTRLRLERIQKTSVNTEVSAVRTRLELVTSCVTGRHSNQLN